MMDAKSISVKNKGQAGTHNSPGDLENQVSPTTTTGDKRWKQTQGRTGSHNNLSGEEPEGLITKSGAGSIVSMTIARTPIGIGRRWVLPRQIGEKGELSKNDRREHKKRRAVRTGLGGEGSEKTIPEVEALEGKISDL